MERIPVTLAASLRPPELLSCLAAKGHGRLCDGVADGAALASTPAGPARRQAEAGAGIAGVPRRGHADHPQPAAVVQT